LAKNLAENLRFEYIDIADTVKLVENVKFISFTIEISKLRTQKFYTEFDEEMDTFVLDEDKLLDFLEVLKLIYKNIFKIL
jgi:broad-specificity NMP kinase